MGNGRFTDGLLFGAILGGAVVFLLGTKKGNRVLKVLTEEGMAQFNDILEEIEEARNEAKEIEADESDEDYQEMVVEEPKINNETTHKSESSKSSKRFFKKSK
jgi:hypothetical protein